MFYIKYSLYITINVIIIIDDRAGHKYWVGNYVFWASFLTQNPTQVDYSLMSPVMP